MPHGVSSCCSCHAWGCGFPRFTFAIIILSTFLAGSPSEFFLSGWQINTQRKMNMKLTLSFSDPQSTKVEHSGGKGANLARLARDGFPVPPGFIITAQGYREFMAGAAGAIPSVNEFPF